MSEVVAKVFRAETVESLHSGSVAVVDNRCKLKYYAGEPNFFTYLRSSAKPFQTFPLIETGAGFEFDFTEPEIALISGSHNGEKIHIETVKKILKKAKLQERWLKCGTQAPLFYTVLGKLPNRAEKFSVLQHNCSGKHSGMMALSVYLGWKPQNYYKPEHPVQKMILKSVSELCSFPQNKIGLGTDGCSLPNFALPLKNMAYGFARLAESVANQKTNPDPFGIIGKAMRKYPLMVSGKGRFDYVLAVATKGRVISKAGAEALSCVAVPEEKLGIAVRITDGASRAVAPVVIETLRQLGIINKDQLERLADFYKPKVKNFNHWEVGYIKPEFKLKKVR